MIRYRILTGFFLWALLLAATSLFQFSLQEDIYRYSENIIELSDQEDSLSFTDDKAVFYLLVTMPIYAQSGSIEETLTYVRLAIVTVFFLAFYKRTRTLFDSMVVGLVLLLIPSFVIQFQEYLRQGLAVAIVFFGFAVNSRGPKILLIPFGAIVHSGVLPLIAAWFIFRIMRSYVTWDQLIFLCIAAFPIALLFQASVYTFPAVSGYLGSLNFFSGERSNFFGFLFVFCYSGWLLLEFLRHRNSSMFCALALSLMFLLMYPLVLDFGRLASFVSITHFYSLSSLDARKEWIGYIAAILFSIIPFII